MKFYITHFTFKYALPSFKSCPGISELGNTLMYVIASIYLFFIFSLVSNFKHFKFSLLFSSTCEYCYEKRSIFPYFELSRQERHQGSIKSYFHYGKRDKSNDNLNLQFLALLFYCAFFSICLKELVFYWK